MNTLDTIAKRTSIRAYKPMQILEEALDTILKAGMAAPVGSGQYDSLHLTVIQNMELLNEIGNKVTALVQKTLGKKLDKNFGAPTMIIVSAKQGHVPGVEYANAACILENMALAATDMGIDNIVWGGAAVVVSQDDSLRSKLEIPKGFPPVLCASFGYGAVEEPAKVHTISVNRI